jgi:hypothetical protein
MGRQVQGDVNELRHKQTSDNAPLTPPGRTFHPGFANIPRTCIVLALSCKAKLKWDITQLFFEVWFLGQRGNRTSLCFSFCMTSGTLCLAQAIPLTFEITSLSDPSTLTPVFLLTSVYLSFPLRDFLWLLCPSTEISPACVFTCFDCLVTCLSSHLDTLGQQDNPRSLHCQVKLRTQMFIWNKKSITRARN